MASQKFSAETWRHWEKSGRDQYIKAISSHVKDANRTPLFTKSGRSSGVLACLYELLGAAVAGHLKKEAVISTLQEICAMHVDIPNILLDVMCLLDAETCSDSPSEERTVFSHIVRELERFIPEKLLKERLEIDTLRDVGILKNNHFQTKFIKVKTKLYYKQRKFNLFREESEGFAKLITELNQEINDTTDWKTLLEIIKSLIGCFNLDPNRVLDIILESFEARPHEENLFIPLIKNYMGDPQVICEVLGFKLGTSEVGSEDDSRPSPLMTVIALLLQHQVIGLDDIYPWLRPDDSVMARAAEKDMKAAQDYIRRINIVSTKGPQPNGQPETVEEAAGPQYQERYWLNQKLVLATALLQAGALQVFSALASRLPEHAVTAPRPVASALAKLLHATIEPLYREKGRVAPKILGKPVPPLPSPLAPKLCQTFEDLKTDVIPALILLGPSLHYDPVLMCKIIRLLRASVSENWCLRYEALTLLDAAILPALTLMQGNCCMAEEVNTLLKLYPVENRYCLYARWKNEWSERVPALARVRGASLQRIKQIMKRVSKENIKPQGRLIGKLSHASPAFLFDYMLLQIQINDNFIGPVVESLKYLTSLSYDVLGSCLLEALAANGGPASLGAGGHSPWLQSLAAFTGAAFKKYNIDLTALLQYVANRLKAEHSQDLLILKELVQKMAGIESSEEMTAEQLEAMAGGELLKGEAGYFSQVRNTRRSSARLKEAVVGNNLDIALCILAAQQRHCCVWKGTDWEQSEAGVGAGSQLKVVGRLVDQCQDALVQLGTFLASVHSAEEYAARLPSLQELIRDYNVGTEVAFFLHRPVLSQKITSRAEALRKASDSKSESSEQALVRFADASKEVLEPVVESVTPLLPLKVWEDISPEFYVTFWSLTMYDLRVPVESYQREIDKLRASADAAARDASADSKMKKEQDRFQTLIDKLQEEMRRQQEHVSRVRARLERECAGWFPARAVKSAKNETVTRLMQLCLFPRCVFTPADALYCAEFVHTVHALKTPNFSTLLCYDRLFCDITYSVMSCTEGEAARYGTFLRRVLATAMHWHSSREAFQRECAHYPGFVTKYRVSNQFSEANEHVGYENYRHVCHKWHFKITKAMVVCLDSGDYAQIRNALIVLIRILPHFPVLTKLSQIIERKIDKVQEEEKNVRQDLFVLATSYHGLLRTKVPSMMRETEFHQVQTVAATNAASAPLKEEVKREPNTNGNNSSHPPEGDGGVKESRSERRRTADQDPALDREKQLKREAHGSGRLERERMKEEGRRKDRSPRDRSHRVVEERYLETVSPPQELRHAPEDIDRDLKRRKIEGSGVSKVKDLEERSPDKEKRKTGKPRTEDRKERKMSRKRDRAAEEAVLEQKRRREEQKALKLAAHQNGSQEEHHYEKYHKREKSPFRERSHEHPEPRDKQFAIVAFTQKMDFDLSRIDYTITGVTFPETMKLVPGTTPKMEQKVAIGDKNGVLQCFGIKNEEPQVIFKTLPGKEITSVQLGGAPGTLADKIFVASGNEVKGYTRKGKVFVVLETNLSETITSMCVSGADLVLGSGRTVTHYRDLQEVNTYVCEDRVLDIVLLHAINSTRVRLVAAVANKGLLLLELGKTVDAASVPSGPTRLVTPPEDYQNVQDPVVIYGAADGSIGIVTFTGNKLEWRCLLPTAGLAAAAVSCAAWWELSGATYLIVGRHDGSIQIFLLDPDNFPDKPKLKYTYMCGERVTSVAGGCVGDAAEVLAATYSGRVFALRPRHRAPEKQHAVAARLAALQTEVSRLERQVAAERDRYQRNTRTPLSTSAGLSAPPVLHLEDELTGVLEDNWQQLRLNSAVPLDLLLLHCSHNLHLQTDSVAVLSTCPSPDSTGEYLATVRCQAGTRRLCVKLRDPRPRACATLRVYAVPAGAPRVARCRKYKLTALAHYSRHEAPEREHSLTGEGAWSTLIVRGTFSAAEMTSWLTRALPGEPPRAASTVTVARSHILIPTNIFCTYSKGTATFKSDDVSTIAILKDVLSKCSVERNITLDMDCSVAGDCVLKSFKRVEELLKREYQKVHEAFIRKAIGELDLDTSNRSEMTAPLLCADYTRIMQEPSSNDDDIHQLLIDTVRDWYKDACSLQLQPCSQALLQELTLALKDNRLDKAAQILDVDN